MVDDVGEEHDLSPAMPEKVRELRADLAAWRNEVAIAPFQLGSELPETY